MKECCNNIKELLFSTVHNIVWMIIRQQEGGDKYLWYQKYPYTIKCSCCYGK